MNSAEIFSENKKAIATFYKTLSEHLNKVGSAKGFEVTSKEPQIENRSNENQIRNLALLRFNTNKTMTTFAIGFSQPEFLTVWHQWAPPVADDPAAAAKSPEAELMKSLFPFLENELKSLGFVIDPKTAMIQQGVQLGGWESVASSQSLVLPFSTPLGELNFEVPLFNVDFARQRTFDLYGFKDNIRIMVVDDSVVSRKTSRTCLAMAGYYNVDETSDGQQAFTKIFGSRPAYDLVVADWHMPVMSGIELLKKIRAVPDFKKLAVIMVTGEKNKDEVVSAIREGVTAYIVKPVAIENFFKALKKASGQA